MKTLSSILCLVAAFTFAITLPSCEKSKGPGEKVGEKIDDALDKRPGEKVRDAVEDLTE